MTFEDQIKEKLIGLNHKQLCQFAWLCGLRALPFLSVERDFAYWPSENRQKHLYSIFNALDVSVSSLVVKSPDAADAAKAFFAVKSFDAVKATSLAVTNVAYAAAKASFASFTTDADTLVADAATFAADAATFTALAADATKAAYINRFDWKSLLLNDIEAIKKNKLHECNHDINIYGGLWDRFQEDLKANDCAYWAQFYENLFKNGFNIDKEQLKRHLGVPDEIKAEGAAAVGRCLEGLGKEDITA